MLKKIIIFCGMLLLIFPAGCTPPREAPEGETPEHIFNMAADAMQKGEDAVAIDLYYKIRENYPGFKKYMADVLYNLGVLLYKTDRYDEAEKVFQVFISRYGNDPRLRKAYEKLINIYMQALHDEKKGQKIRDLYAKKFGDSPTLKDIDKTMTLLNASEGTGSAVLSMDAGNLGIIRMKTSGDLDREFYPVRNYVMKAVRSPDNKFLVEKKKRSGSYYLFVSPLGYQDKPVMVRDSEGGYAPQWSWDGKYIIFTSMDWSSNERMIKIYDREKKTTRELFRAKGIEPLLGISYDASKIIFSYNGRLWIMNRAGSSVALLHKAIDARNLRMIAWSREGNEIVFVKKGEDQQYYTCALGRREIETIK